MLAAGRSVDGIKKEPGPYRMNQEHLLPKFPATVRLTTIDETAAVEGSPDPRTTPETSSAAEADQTQQPLGASRPSALGRLLGKLRNPFRRKQPTVPAPAVAVRAHRQPVQGELALGAVKVVRNDLRDCDGEESAGMQPGARRQPMGIVWNRLSARLLRQAVLDFNLVQKERGKFLSQAGSGSGGPHGA